MKTKGVCLYKDEGFLEYWYARCGAIYGQPETYNFKTDMWEYLHVDDSKAEWGSKSDEYCYLTFSDMDTFTGLEVNLYLSYYKD